MEAVSFGQGLKRLRRKKKRAQKNGTALWKSFFSRRRRFIIARSAQLPFLIFHF